MTLPASPAPLQRAGRTSGGESYGLVTGGHSTRARLVIVSRLVPKTPRKNNPQVGTTHASQDWLAEYFRQHPAKDIARKAGVGTRAAEGIKGGKHGMTMAHIVSMCRNDPEFRAAFFKHCGGILEGSPEMVNALARAVNEVVRAQAERGA